MLGKDIGTNTGHNSRYNLRSNPQTIESENISQGGITANDLSVQNMATTRATSSDSMASEASERGPENVTLSDIQSILLGLDRKMEDGFGDLRQKLDTVTEKIESLELDVEHVKAAQKEDRVEINELKTEISDLRNSLLLSQVYSRKYHLLLYGVPGHEDSTNETIQQVRRFAKESLNLSEDFADKMTIRNAHRLQKRDGPATIIVAFLHWNERETFLRAGTNLRKTKMSIRTDLPPVLKRKRGELATEAWKMRQHDNIHTRVREKGIDVWLETRPNANSPWRRI